MLQHASRARVQPCFVSFLKVIVTNKTNSPCAARKCVVKVYSKQRCGRYLVAHVLTNMAVIADGVRRGNDFPICGCDRFDPPIRITDRNRQQMRGSSLAAHKMGVSTVRPSIDHVNKACRRNPGCADAMWECERKSLLRKVFKFSRLPLELLVFSSQPLHFILMQK